MLVLRPGALGDTLLAVPALRVLRAAFGSVTLAAHPSTARLLASVGEVTRGMAFDDPTLARLYAAGESCDDMVVAWMAAPPKCAGVMAPSRPPGMDEHCARYLLNTLAQLGIDLAFDDRPLRVVPMPSDEVLVHPGSGSPTKNWPADRFAAVIRVLSAPATLVVGEADAGAADQVDAALGRRVKRLEQPSLEELAGRLAGCHAYLGNDSGVSHLAGLCGARTVALFGPSNPGVWRPIGPDVRVLSFGANPDEVAAALLG